MKPAKDWAADMRESLGNGLRYDPCLTNGKTLIEVMVEAIQADALSGEQGSQQPPKEKE